MQIALTELQNQYQLLLFHMAVTTLFLFVFWFFAAHFIFQVWKIQTTKKNRNNKKKNISSVRQKCIGSPTTVLPTKSELLYRTKWVIYIYSELFHFNGSSYKKKQLLVRVNILFSSLCLEITSFLIQRQFL